MIACLTDSLEAQLIKQSGATQAAEREVQAMHVREKQLLEQIDVRVASRLPA